MKILTFLARRFWWKTHERTLDTVELRDEEQEMRDAVVVFLHAEKKDQEEAARRSVVRQTVKHVKWLANKRELSNVVLHSFTHLGGENADADFAEELLAELTLRLRNGGYEVATTPFGYFCEWNLDVFGESLAKVFKEI